MRSTTKSVMKGLFLAGAVVLPMSSSYAATSYDWDFSYNYDCVSPSPASACAPWTSYREYVDTAGTSNDNTSGRRDGTQSVRIETYLGTNSGTISQGRVESWSGIGAKQSGSDYDLTMKNSSGSWVTKSSDNAPFHAVNSAYRSGHKGDDNYLEYEAVLLDFGAGNLMDLDNFSIGWPSSGYDTDISILAYTKGDDNGAATSINLAGQTWGNLVSSNDWSHIDDKSDVAKDATIAINTGNVKSRYWLIGAYNPVFNSSHNWSRGNDTFKLETVAGKVSGYVPPPPPNTGVPLPAPLALMGIGMVAIGRRFSNK